MNTVAAGAGDPQRKGTAEAAFGEQFLAELCARLVTRLLLLQRLSSSKTALAIFLSGRKILSLFYRRDGRLIQCRRIRAGIF